MSTPAEQEALFRALFETAPDAMIVVDREGTIVLANAQADRLFGYPERGLYGLALECLLPERLRGGHSAHRERFMSNPRVRPMGAGFELVGLRSDGTEFPVEIGLSPVHGGAAPLYAASIRDISETQRARQALTRARYDAVIGEVGRLALESHDYETLLGRLPHRVAEALGIDAVAVLIAGTQRYDLSVRAHAQVPPALLDRLPDLLGIMAWSARLATPGRAALTLAEFDARDEGGLRAAAAAHGYVDAALLPLFDRYEPTGALLAFTKNARSLDRDKLNFLQSIGHLLSAALQRNRSEEQLAHAQRLDAIGQLTGGVAHDFNNLLTVISGNLQLLEDDTLGLERGPIIQSALRAVGNGAALTRKLLAFARRQHLSPRPIAPRAWLTDLSALLTRTLGEAVRIRIECTSPLPEVFADPGELDAALVNLALNARDAMPRGGELTIAAGAYEGGDAPTVELAPGRYVEISVTDTGIGMAPDVLARALEPFYTTKSAGKGSGLGLSMVYGFVKQSGGTMAVDSQLGYGTRVALYLPAAAESRESAPPRPKVAAARGGETVLVVEDEPDVRDVAIAFLHSLGYASRVAASAEEALERLRAEPVDLLFSDVILGSGMTGVDLAREARRLNPGLPVLLVSGYEQALLDDAKDGELKLLRKPYGRDEFAAAIRQALDAA
jgi:PAS domain S-box-containing protein